MKKLILVSLICAFSTVVVLSQTTDQLVKEKRQYSLNNKKLNNKELKAILKSDQESAIVYKKAQTATTIGSVFAGVGTVVILIAALNPPAEKEGPLPGLVSDEEMNKHLVPVFIGAGIVLAGIPFLISGNMQLKKSITIYNSKHTVTGFRNELKLDIGISQNGVGLVYRF